MSLHCTTRLESERKSVELRPIYYRNASMRIESKDCSAILWTVVDECEHLLENPVWPPMPSKPRWSFFHSTYGRYDKEFESSPSMDRQRIRSAFFRSFASLRPISTCSVRKMVIHQRFLFLILIVCSFWTIVEGRAKKCSAKNCALPSCQCAVSNANPTAFEVSQLPQLVRILGESRIESMSRLDSSDVCWKFERTLVGTDSSDFSSIAS